MFKVGDPVESTIVNMQGKVVYTDNESLCVKWNNSDLETFNQNSELIKVPNIKSHEGWINVFRTLNNESSSYYFGSEISASKEDGMLKAKSIRVQNAYVDTVFVKWEDRQNV